MLPPPPGPSPEPAPVTTGERRFGVNFENLPASTRSLSRVGSWRLSATLSRRETEAGTRTMSLRLVARRGLAKAVRPSLARKITVFLVRVDLKRRPVIVSVPPTLIRIGWTRVIVGAGVVVAAVAAAGSTRRAAATSVRQVVTMRRMPSPYRLSGSLLEFSRRSLATTTRSARIGNTNRRVGPTDARAFALLLFALEADVSTFTLRISSILMV